MDLSSWAAKKARPRRTGRDFSRHLPADGRDKASHQRATHQSTGFRNPLFPRDEGCLPPAKTVKDTIAKWTWHDLGYFIPDKQVAVVVEKPGLFGWAVEDKVRKLFEYTVLKKWGNKRAGGGQYLKGADIYWTELARFYDELARELGDPFYADLASELASFSRETVDWDAA